LKKIYRIMAVALAALFMTIMIPAANVQADEAADLAAQQEQLAAANYLLYTQILEANEQELARQQEAAAQAAEQAAKAAATPAVSYSWRGPVLTAYRGSVYGPSGKEVYYNMNMSGVVSALRRKGYSGNYWVRNDGVKMFGSYIMVAANYGVHPYGSIVQTSLGAAIVCDTGTFARSYPNCLDIATSW
jgi:hypothetical protein